MNDVVLSEYEQGEVVSAIKNMDVASKIIHRTFISDMNSFPVLPPKEGQKIVDHRKTVRLFKLDRLVYKNIRAMLESATAAYTAMGASGYSVFMLLQSDGAGQHDLYLGTRCSPTEQRGIYAGELLETTFTGHFTGSKLSLVNGKDTNAIFSKAFCDEGKKAITAVTGIPALTTEDKESFIQGIERLIEAAGKKQYIALILAEPVSSQGLQAIQEGYESIATELSPFLTTQLTYGSQDSIAVGVSMSKSMSESLGTSLSLSSGITEQKSHSKSIGKSESDGYGSSENTNTSKGNSHSVSKSKTTQFGLNSSSSQSLGGSLSASIPFIGIGVGVAKSVASTLGLNVSRSIATSRTNTESETVSRGETTSRTRANTTSNTDTYGTSRGRSETTTHGTSHTNTRSTSKTGSETETHGTSEQITRTFQNKYIQGLLQKIDYHLQRMEEARAYGGWQTAAYFIGENTETSRSLAGMYLGLMRGDRSGAEDFALTTWNQETPREKGHVFEWLYNLSHPKLAPDFEDQVSFVTPATLVSGREMALQLSLPRHSTPATTVLEAPSFGRMIQMIGDLHSRSAAQCSIELGKIQHLWRDQDDDLKIDINQLSSHALVTGTTGVGKTTAIMNLLSQVHRAGIPFMAVEPAKGEYRRLLGMSKNGDISCFTAGRRGENALRLNPFIFPHGVELTDHIDRVCTIFNAAFPMYASMPQLLEEAIFCAYEELGWDTAHSRFAGKTLCYPTLRQVTDLIPTVVGRLGYSQATQGDYVAALSSRLNSLCRGALGMTLLCEKHEETPDKTLLEGSSIVDLSAMGSPDKRALIMGLLFMRLYEKRLVQGIPAQPALQHLMVIEEAHALLKRTNTEQNQESSNPQGMAVETFANALAEMRGFGQGFIVADQSASALDDCVLRNTSTKIVMRTPFEKDRDALGGALSLNDEQRNFLARLQNHVAVIHQSNWLEPVLCHLRSHDIPEVVHMDMDPEKGGSEKEKEARSILLYRLLEGEVPFPESFSRKSERESDIITNLNILGLGKYRDVFLKKHPQSNKKKAFLFLFPELGQSSYRNLPKRVSAHANFVLATLSEQTTRYGDQEVDGNLALGSARLPTEDSDMPRVLLDITGKILCALSETNRNDNIIAHVQKMKEMWG